MQNLIQILRGCRRRGRRKEAAEYEDIIFLLVYACRCARWISLGGFGATYFVFSPPLSHLFV